MIKRFCTRLVLVGILLSGWAGFTETVSPPRPAVSQDKKGDQWRGIRSWKANYHETFTSEKTWEVAPGVTMSTTIESTTTGTYTLEDKIFEDADYIEWYGTGTASYEMKKTSTMEGGGVSLTEVTLIRSSGISGTGKEEDTEDQYGGNVVIDLYSGTYNFGFAGPMVEGEETLTRTVEGLPTDFSQINNLPLPLRAIFAPLGAKAQEIATYDGPLSGTSTMLIGDIMGMALFPDMSMPTEYELPERGSALAGSWSGKNTSFSWSLSPSGQDEPLLLEKCPEEWRPSLEGNDNDTVTLSLQGRGWFGSKVVIRYTLSHVTRERGTSMNGSDLAEGPDLDFDHDSNGSVFEDPETRGSERGGSKVEYTIQTREPVLNAPVRVVSRDWGAWGRLKADVSFEDSEQWMPVFTRDGKRYITIPLDEDGGENYMADSWEREAARMRDSTYEVGSPPNKDMDDYPRNAHKGDGLSNYEEYRGFYIRGVHQRTNPGIKDLFIRVDDARLIPGVLKLGEATNIRIRQIDAGEYVNDGTRVINPNRKLHTVTEQHGIFLTAPAGNPGRGGVRTLGQAQGAGPGNSDLYGAAGNPGHNPGNPAQSEYNGTPGWKSRVVVYPDNHTRGRIPLNYTVVHELLHCLSVDHHGEYYTSGQRLCDGGMLGGADCVNPAVLRSVITLWAGPNSGDDTCVVSYPSATYFTDSTGGVARGADGTPLPFQASPDLTTHICRSPAGTGPNGGGRQVGDAAKGNCWDQIKISDGGR